MVAVQLCHTGERFSPVRARGNGQWHVNWLKAKHQNPDPNVTQILCKPEIQFGRKQISPTNRIFKSSAGPAPAKLSTQPPNPPTPPPPPKKKTSNIDTYMYTHRTPPPRGKKTDIV